MLIVSYFDFSCKIISKTQQWLSMCCWIFRDFTCNCKTDTSKGFDSFCSLVVIEELLSTGKVGIKFVLAQRWGSVNKCVLGLEPFWSGITDRGMLLIREERALGMLVWAVWCSLSKGTMVFNYLRLPQCLPSMSTLLVGGLGWTLETHRPGQLPLCFHCTHPHLDTPSLSLSSR